DSYRYLPFADIDPGASLNHRRNLNHVCSFRGTAAGVSVYNLPHGPSEGAISGSISASRTRLTKRGSPATKNIGLRSSA
ncbi:MAG TPA: hypothetical protein VM120_05605, partial [Bryobacteraceae bacterium]|nr:hypothetical protein [Bryobacteraceae bacterium]